MKILTDLELNAEQLKKKRAMLLNMAIDAVQWGEGSDFEWRELVSDGNYEKTIAEVYGVKYPIEDDYGGALDPTDEDEKAFDKACNEWEDLTEKVQDDVVELLKYLRGD